MDALRMDALPNIAKDPRRIVFGMRLPTALQVLQVLQVRKHSCGHRTGAHCTNTGTPEKNFRKTPE